MEGWIKLHRQIFDNPLYFSEPFTRCQAWIDLLMLANTKDGYFYKRGIRVEVIRGQVGYDIESLAKRWKWSRGKVERFINVLESDNQVIRQKTNVTTLISICNYDKYQTGSNPNDNPNSKADGHQTVKQTVKQTDTNKNKENKKKEKELIKDKPEIPILTLNEKFLLSIPGEWNPIVKKWLDFKKEKNQPYKGSTSLTSMFDKLTSYSNDNPVIGSEIIEKSIACNWSGFFKLKAEYRHPATELFDENIKEQMSKF